MEPKRVYCAIQAKSSKGQST